MKLPHRQKGSYEINMTEGALLGKLIQFSIPLALSGILQLLFNAADIWWWADSRAATLWRP